MQRVELDGDHPQDIFEFALQEMNKGISCVLILVHAVKGPSARSVGTPMVVLEDGRCIGYVSNGCLDIQIAVQSLESLKTGAPQHERYGKGSPYMDLRLPCGGTLDVVFLPNPESSVLSQLCAKLSSRGEVSVELTPNLQVTDETDTGFRYTPRLRVVIFGEGQETARLESAVKASGQEVVLNPHLTDFSADPWTAIVLLFHDHEREIDILTKVIESEAFYIGAMGSRRSHEERLNALEYAGLSSAQRNRIKGPIGLVPSARDAGRLAISVLAEIFETDRLRVG